MYSDISSRIKKIRGQIEDVSYRMIEADESEYEDLESELEQLEEELEYHVEMANDLKEAYEQINRS